MVGGCLRMPFRKIVTELWLLLQLIGPIGLLWESVCEQSSFFIFCWIFMKLAFKNDIHKIWDKIENGSDWINNSTRVLQKVLSLRSDYFSATFYQTYFYYKPSKYSPFTETHFCNLFTQSRKASSFGICWRH